MKRWDFAGVMARISTWLGLLTLAQGGAMVAYSQAPAEWQAALPEYVGAALLVGMMVTGALTPIATSFRQKKLSKQEGAP